MPSTNPLRSGTWAITLLAMITSARRPSLRSWFASSVPKKARRVGTPRRSAAAAWSGAGSMPSTGTPCSTKLREQVAVVARHLDDEAVGAETAALDQALRMCSRAWSASMSENDEKYR